MLRFASALLLSISTLAAAAHADVWMVKSSGILACDTREKLMERDAAAGASGSVGGGCVMLSAGERLLDKPEVGLGFNPYLRVQRSDRSVIFVPSSAIAADPGIGSVTEDRE